MVMRVYKVKNYDEMSRQAAGIIASMITLNPACVLGLATGSTPEGIYRELIKGYNNGDLDFSEVKSVNLDEYQGLDPNNDQSYYYYMTDKLFNHVNIKKENYHLPNGLAEDAAKECARYDEIIKSLGGVDLQLLGIGINGHIGFNEPSEKLEKDVHLAKLTESTINANARFFKSYDDIPKHAFTMGVRTIMSARKIVLAASGKSKAEIMPAVINGPITTAVPASLLQLHPDVTIIADEDALSLL